MNKRFTSLLQVLAGGFRWWLPAEQRSDLIGPQGLRLEEWIRDGQARVVKEGPHRIVYRVELPGLVFYLKRNLLPDLRSWLRQLVRPSKARIEFTRALDVASRGLPTVVPLALGEKRSFLGIGESYLITRSLEDTQPLNAFLLQVPGACSRARLNDLRKSLARELGYLMGRIHQAGILHNDLHTGNILVRENPSSQFSLFLIDLNTVRLGSPLNWRTSLENLAMLNRSFIFASNRTDRLRFWRAYFQARRVEGWSLVRDMASSKELACKIERYTIESFQGFSQRFERRSLGSNRYFRKVCGAGLVGNVATDLDPADYRRLLADPDEPFRRPDAPLHKDGHSTTVTEFDVRIGGQVRRVIYKRFLVTHWTDGLASLFRPTPALRSWLHANALLRNSLPTPRPLLLLQRRRFGMSWEGYLLTEKVENAQDLHEFLASLNDLPAAESRQCLRQRIDQVARVMRELHRSRFSNRDPKASNWLLGRALPQTTMERRFGGAWIIDLVGLRHERKMTQHKRVKNLARLNASFSEPGSISRTDRLRFLRIYMQWSLAGKEGWKRWWRAIAALTRLKVARNSRLNRVLQ